MRYIDQKDVMIVWNPMKEGDGKFITMDDLYVYEYTRDDRRHNRERDHYERDSHRHLTYSTGNCDNYWVELTTEEIICQCFRIILFYKPKDEKHLKKILIQFGKIKQLEAVRSMIYWGFPCFQDEMTYEEFKEVYYE